MTELPPMPTAEQKAAAFNFARALKDPTVRQQLKDHGYSGDGRDTIITVMPGQPLQAPWETSGRALLVQQDDTQPTGWAMAWAVPA